MGRDVMELDADEMQAVVKRLKRAQGQIGGIIKMIEDGRECQDIVTQMAAVSKALDRAGFERYVRDVEGPAPVVQSATENRGNAESVEPTPDEVPSSQR